MTPALQVIRTGLTGGVLLALASCAGQVDWGNGPPPALAGASSANRAQSLLSGAEPDRTNAALKAPVRAEATPVRARPIQPSARDQTPDDSDLLAALFSGRAGAGTEDEAPDDATDTGFVRAPELFTASGLAVWNGRGTVPGIWVAHPKARGSTRIRILNSRSGAEVDGMLYRPRRRDNGDVITVSSDAAAALGLEPGRAALLRLYGLRPRGTTSPSQRRAVETTALGELASHIARMSKDQTLHLVAAAMRGMGYATVFEEGPPETTLPAIRAFPRPDQGFELPSIRVVVRPQGKAPMTGAEIRPVQDWLTGSGDLGVMVSVPGFADNAEAGLSPDAAYLQMVDLDGLLNIWLTHYGQLSSPDRALMPLQPVYFLARN